ncbi:MAG: hypothetical protein ACTSRP_05640 [Candidatus Helarchaeota archaeon]
MIRCEKCDWELEIHIKDNNKILLICPNPKCEYRSSEIEINDIGKIISSKIIESKIVKNDLKKDRIAVINDNLYKEEYLEDDKLNSSIINVFKRKGKIKKYNIFCLDFSSRMDINIPYNEDYLNSLVDKIKMDKILPNSIKNELYDLIKPPISFIRASIFAFSWLIYNNIKKMTVEDFQSIQIVALTGKSEEIFRFPNFINQTTLDILVEFIKIAKIKRNEYKSLEILNYRDFSNALEKIAELIIEIKEISTYENIDIYFYIIGDHMTKDNQYFNPIRKIIYTMEDLEPFTINVINLNITGSDSLYQQMATKYHGIYSKEFTLKGLLNAIIYGKYGSDLDSYSSIKTIKKISEKRRNSKSIKQTTISDIKQKKDIKYKIEEKPEYISTEDKAELDNAFINNYLNQYKEIKVLEDNIERISIQRKADKILEKLIDEIKRDKNY